MLDVLAGIIDEADEYYKRHKQEEGGSGGSDHGAGATTYLRNAMAIASRVPEVFGKVTIDDGEVVRDVCGWDHVPRAFKVTYCWAAAKAFRDNHHDEGQKAEF